MVIGAPKSGKTLTINMLMRSVLPGHVGRPGADHRALVYDHKREAVSVLAGMGVPYKILSPFDARCSAWDVSKDITDLLLAEQFAEILIPQKKEIRDPFFDNAARDLVEGVVCSLLEVSPGAWGLRDVLAPLFGPPQNLAAFLKLCPGNAHLHDTYFDDPRLGVHVMATVRSELKKYRKIAALWSHAKDQVSIAEWLRPSSSWVLVLGSNHAARAAMNAVNAIVFRRVVDLILEQGESKDRRTWIFFDEVKQAGKLSGLSDLMVEGRSRGACVVLGMQDVEGFREVYGEKEANEIIGLCRNRAVLRSDCPQTAQWATSLFGTREVVEEQLSSSAGQHTETQKSTSKGSHTEESKSKGSSKSESKNKLFGDKHGLLVGALLSPFKNEPWFKTWGKDAESLGHSTEEGNQEGSGTSTGQSAEQTDGTSNGSSTEEGMTLIRKEVRLLLDSEVSGLPDTNEANGLTGFFISFAGCARVNVPWSVIFGSGGREGRYPRRSAEANHRAYHPANLVGRQG
jgi:hypothetical protein